MTGTERQMKWANDIVMPVQEIIARMPADIKGKHEMSFSRIESAATVINCRHQISDWCQQVEEWFATGVFASGMMIVPSTEPPVIRSVVC